MSEKIKPGDLVTSTRRPSVDDLGLVLESSPTIGTDVRMIEVFWSPSSETGLYPDNFINVINHTRKT